jgi:hypothetical protein
MRRQRFSPRRTFPENYGPDHSGRNSNGGRGIRTPKSLRTPVFKTGALAILPALPHSKDRRLFAPEQPKYPRRSAYSSCRSKTFTLTSDPTAIASAAVTAGQPADSGCPVSA